MPRGRRTAGGRLLLRDIPEAGDASHLPADHFAHARFAGRDRAKAGGGRALSVRQNYRSRQAGHCISLRRFWFKQFARAPWQISAGEVRYADPRSRRRESAAPAHLLRAHRRPSPAVDPRLGKTVGRFVSRRRCDGRPRKAGVSRGHERDARSGAAGPGALGIARARARSRSVVPPGKSGFSGPAFRSTKSRFERAMWPGDGAWKFVQACRLIEKKGLQDSLRAFAKFADALSAIHASRLPAKDRSGLSWKHGRASSASATRFHFPVSFRRRDLRELFYHSHIFLHPSERGARRKSGRRSELDARSDGERAAGVRDRARRHPGSDRARQERNSGAGRRSRSARARPAGGGRRIRTS